MKGLSKIMVKLALLVMLVGVLYFLCIVFLNSYILRHSKSVGLRVLVQMIAPPKDIFNYLVKEKIDISKKDLVRRYKYTNKYLGKCSIGILLDNFPNTLYFEKKHKLKLVMAIKFYSENNLLLSFMTKGEYSPFIGRTGSGLILMTYKCPEDLPIDKPLECEVQIVEPDGDLNNAYGPVKFYIEKMSDE